MRFDVAGKQVFASTGGRKHQPQQPWIIFIHGAGQNHLTWSQQVRAFAYDGYNVVAPDLPGHGDTQGKALTSVEAMAEWIISVMDALEIDSAHIVNHSMGGLISLEIAAQHPVRVKSVVFIATAMTIAVGDILIQWAKNEPQKAIDMMTSLGHSSYGHHHDTSVPGTSLIGFGLQVMQQNQPDALPADLVSCVDYKNGVDAALKVACPAMCLLSSVDRMVKPAFGKKLCETLADCELHMFDDSGHMIPTERPREINKILRAFYNKQKT